MSHFTGLVLICAGAAGLMFLYAFAVVKRDSDLMLDKYSELLEEARNGMDAADQEKAAKESKAGAAAKKTLPSQGQIEAEMVAEAGGALPVSSK